MNREILFRGKKIDNGEWIEGSLITTKYNYYIVPIVDETIKALTYISVIPETVGQYVNHIDKQGNKVFENDTFIDQTITWSDETNGFYLKDKYGEEYHEKLEELHIREITGNIYDKN